MSTTHTPGPWQWVDPSSDEPWNGESYMPVASLRTVEVFGEDRTDVIDGKRYTRFALPVFVLHYCESMGENEEARANARLIAAAPELLEALLEAKDWLTASNSPHGLRERIGAALAKARGVA